MTSLFQQPANPSKPASLGPAREHSAEPWRGRPRKAGESHRTDFGISSLCRRLSQRPSSSGSPILKSTPEACLDVLRGTRHAKLVPKVGVTFQWRNRVDPQFPGPAGSHGPSVPLPATPRPVPPSPPRILGSQGAGVIPASVAASSPSHQSKGPPRLGHRNPQGRPERDQHRRGSGQRSFWGVTVSPPPRGRGPRRLTGPRRLAPPRPAPAGRAPASLHT